jgi:two-component system chemotaxis response regulator CheB
LRALIRALPADLQAAIFIVMHLSPLSPSILPKLLSGPGTMKVSAALDSEPIRPGHVYVAQPDLHMLVEPGYVRLTRGPRENRHRPAIDPLFRTAARAYGRRVIGIVLTGLLDDGTLGLHVVKSEGGIAIIQDPEDAMFDAMPRNALKTVDADYVLKVAEMPEKILQLVDGPWEAIEPGRGKDILREFPRPEGEKMSEELDERVMGKPSMFTCPDCSGTLWEVTDGDLLRFRCRVGHAFSPESMRDGYTDSVEGALWTAVRILEESAALERKLSAYAAARGDDLTADRFTDAALGREEQAAMIRNMLITKESAEQKADEIA